MLKVKGTITSGRGEGSKYVGMHIYNEILSTILNAKPFNGTLNVVLNNLNFDELITYCTPSIVNDIHTSENTYGGFYYWRCRVINAYNGISENVIALRPFRSSNPKNVIELVSGKYLREYLKLEDGNPVILEFLC